MSNLGSDGGGDEREQLIHDLEVHQAELESQNHQLRETQELLEQSRARYADLFDFAPIAYCTFDPNGVIREINLTGAALLGSERGRLIGKPFIACAPMTDTMAFVNHLRECMAGPGPCTTELTLLQPGRAPLVLQVVSAASAGLNGAPSGCRSALTDISVRKKAEDALRLALRMREDFLAIVSHELRNPLSSILMGTELLLMGTPVKERRRLGRPQLESTLRAAKRMTRLVTDLLDLSSMEAGHLAMHREIHDVRDILSAAFAIAQPLALLKSVRLELSLPPDPLPADCDRERIVQVLVNLASNAIKFTPAGGTIVVEARAVGDTTLCAVRDSGVGIALDERLNLFKPYWQAASRERHKGAGLGLSIAKGIIDFHGGKIWLGNSTASGSSFMFTLPVSTAGRSPMKHAPPLPARPTATPDPHVDGSTILVVDDEVDMRDSLTQILTGEGYQVRTAGNGEEALGCLQRMERRPALILLDLVMPGMDGWRFLAERARDARLSAIPVILISGQADAHALEKEFHLAGCIEKPIEIANLIRALQRVGVSPGAHAGTANTWRVEGNTGT